MAVECGTATGRCGGMWHRYRAVWRNVAISYVTLLAMLLPARLGKWLTCLAQFLRSHSRIRRDARVTEIVRFAPVARRRASTLRMSICRMPDVRVRREGSWS
jgi:hypothetical protein